MSRRSDQLRPIKIRRKFTRSAPGSVLFQAGGTTGLCTASVEARVPEWLEGRGKGWITAEYNMLPGSTNPRKRRDRGTKIGQTPCCRPAQAATAAGDKRRAAGEIKRGGVVLHQTSGSARQSSNEISRPG